MTPSLQEVIVDNEVEEQREAYEMAREIMVRLIEERESVSIVDMYVLCRWLIDTNNFTEDAVVMLDAWAQENDISISDEFAYYRSIMEETPISR